MGAAGSNGYQLGPRPVSSGFARYPADDVSNTGGRHCHHFAKWLWKVWAPTAQSATIVTPAHRAKDGQVTRPEVQPVGFAPMILAPSQRRLAGTPPTLARHFRIKIVAYHVHMNRARLAERATL